MLTRELAIAKYDWQRGCVEPDRLRRTTHAHYRALAERMIGVYQVGQGRTRQELHRDLHFILSEDAECPLRRMDAFCKLLDDAAEFHTDRQRKAARLRRQVFGHAARFHPLVQVRDGLFQTSEHEVKTAIAQELGKTWPEIERELYADVTESHRLRSFTTTLTAEKLLARYNVAQVQAALYDAQRMTIYARTDFKIITRAVKLSRLMHSISRASEDELCIVVDGPASVLRNTTRYGAAMARMIPSLLRCRDWRLHARLLTPRKGWQMSLHLSSASGLSSDVAGEAEFDSDLERKFAEQWGPESRQGWRLIREGDVLYKQQHVFVPDFVAVHDDGRRVFMEIIGFWTPEYLSAKCTTLQRFADTPMLLLVGPSATKAIPPELSLPVIQFKTAIRPADVLAKLERITC